MAKITKDALSGIVYDNLKRMIADGVLIPGQKIVKKELGETLGVSQTPIIEALNRLTGEGLVERKGRDGQFVKEFTYADTADLFAVRAGLSGVSLRVCVEELSETQLKPLIQCFDGFELPFDKEQSKRYRQADQRFHELIVELAAIAVIKGLADNFDFILKTYQKGLIRPGEETLGEHREIIKAVMNRDVEKAQQLIIDHDLKTREYIIDTFLRDE